MAGARFVRADLHVHINGDGATSGADPAAYVGQALEQGISVLGVTDHNDIGNVQAVLAAASGEDLLVLPGIEVTTHQGHLVALFAPDAMPELADFHRSLALRPDPVDAPLRSDQSLLALVGAVATRGGLAILAHVDRDEGLQQRVSNTELSELLAHDGLAGLEFVDSDNLNAWFSAADSDPARSRAWAIRQGNDELRTRGLARLMSSDAHEPSLVGKDGTLRPLTRLRLDDLNYNAVRTALLYNPKGRCKAEAVLPPSYPRVLAASFEGGFLNGVELTFSPNLNCLIGGRGSGKSTALLAIRAALGAPRRPGEDDPDAEGRMPDKTTVYFRDAAAIERVAIRHRGEEPYDANGDPLQLSLADLGQDESGAVARSYRLHPERLLAFTDSLCDVAPSEERERELLALLADNAEEVRRTAFRAEDMTSLKAEQDQLAAQFKSAEGGRLEDVAIWARELATQGALMARVRESLAGMLSPPATTSVPTLEELAEETQTDLQRLPIRPLAPQIEAVLTSVNSAANRLDTQRVAALRREAAPIDGLLETWRSGHAELKERLENKQAELEEQGLKVEAGEIRRLGNRMEDVGKKISGLQHRQRAHRIARAQRDRLLSQLRGNRDELFGLRRSRLRNVSAAANDGSLGLTVHASFVRMGQRAAWMDWLRSKFSFRSPRVDRLAELVTPEELATMWLTDWEGLLALVDTDGDGSPFFTRPQLEGTTMLWSDIFTLETMRLEDRPRIVIEEAGRPRREFDELSTGQQRSVLLSLLLCAGGTDPFIVDQPEDHLDAPFVASAIVHHLELAKERRQLIIATHSANVTVLGDAELVIPLYAEEGHGHPEDVGAVDRPETLSRVCDLLEGGATAYRRRGERYGFRLQGGPGA